MIARTKQAAGLVAYLFSPAHPLTILSLLGRSTPVAPGG